MKFVPKGKINNIPALVRSDPSYHLNQLWLVYWRIYASLGLNELKLVWYFIIICAKGVIGFASPYLRYHTDGNDLYIEVAMISNRYGQV